MHWRGHVGISIALYAPFSYYFMMQDMMNLLGLGLVLMVALSRIPDLDLYFPVKHRGITHTVWFAALMGAFGAGALLMLSLPHDLLFLVAIGFAMGAMSVIGHLVGDILTPMGIQPFAPVRDWKISLGLVYAKNEDANDAFLMIGMLVWLYATASPTVEVLPS